MVDDIKIAVKQVVFSRDTTGLELEFTALDEKPVKLNPWNTTIALRKCVNKNLRVGQVEKIPSIILHPGEPESAWTTYHPVKLSTRLRWIDILVSINRGQGRFTEGDFRIQRETLEASLEQKTGSELDNIIPEFTSVGLFFLYIYGITLVLLLSIMLDLTGMESHYRLLVSATIGVPCVVLLRRQYVKALTEVGYNDKLSLRTWADMTRSAFDPKTRSKAKRRRASQRLHSQLQEKGADDG